MLILASISRAEIGPSLLVEAAANRSAGRAAYVTPSAKNNNKVSLSDERLVSALPLYQPNAVDFFVSTQTLHKPQTIIFHSRTAPIQ